MLKYSYELEEGMHSIINKITVNNNYKVVGSFRRKTKYITDIDINNYIGELSTYNIDSIIKKIIYIINNLPENIFFLYLTSGMMDYPWNIISETEIKNYNYSKAKLYIDSLHNNNIISTNEKDKAYELVTEDPVIDNLLLIEDMIYSRIKIRWFKKDIINGYKIINNNKVNLTDSLNDNNPIVLHYLYKYNNHFVPIDIGLNKGDKKEWNFKVNYLAYLKKEYYYILADIARCNFHNKDIYTNQKYILENMFGHYKQIIMDLFYYGQVVEYNLLDNNNLHTYKNTMFDKINIIKMDNNYKDANDIHSIRKLENMVLKKLNDLIYPYTMHYYSITPDCKLKYVNLLEL